MLSSHLEVERKLSAPEDLVVPVLDGVDGADGVRGVAVVGEPETFELAASYVDTPDLRLARRGITLRRRTGGHDAGWHLKLPRGTHRRAARLELSHPLTELADADGRPAVPASLLDLVRVHVRDRELVVVATVTTQRCARLLTAADGRTLAELADDRVTATDHTRPDVAEATASWRELEVELVDGGPALLDRVEAALRTAGAGDPESGSKLGRALGRPTEPLPRHDPSVNRRSTAGEVLRAYLAEHVGRLQAADPDVRAVAATDPRDPAGTDRPAGARRGRRPGGSPGLPAPDPDAVHQMRVATRRLRSVLATYRPLVDRDVTDPLRSELRWLGELLGDVRDLEVVRARVLGALDALPAHVVRGPVHERLDAHLEERERAARERLLPVLSDPRYYRLLDSLDALAAAPPLRPRAARPARTSLGARVDREWRELARRHDTATRVAGDEPRTRDVALHETRKAAKRTRYAAEVLEPVFGAAAERFERPVVTIQDTLGDHQDAVVVRALLRTVADEAAEAGEDTFTLGVLHAEENVRADAALRAYRRAWEQADRPRQRRWLR